MLIALLYLYCELSN